MVDLAGSVTALVRDASAETDPRRLRGSVEKVLDAFEGASARARDAALRSLGRALARSTTTGAQVLCLALGALVEGGASPELAWSGISPDLGPLLQASTEFAEAAVRRAKDPHVDHALEKFGAEIARKKPREAAAWKALPSRCLAAVACLVRSKALRAKQRKNEELAALAWPLSDAIAEVGYLLQALRIVDDETLLVLAPDVGRGWRVAVDGMPSNAELYILLADALAFDPRPKAAAKRPDPRALAAIRDGVSPKKTISVRVPFQLVAWTAVDTDGALSASDEAAHWIWPEGIPADIPKLGNDRVVLLKAGPAARAIPAAVSFEGLRPSLRVIEELSSPEVVRAMVKLAKAAATAQVSRPPRARKRRTGRAKTPARARSKKKK